MLAALTMGRRFGLVTIDPMFIDWHERQVRAHGLEARVAGVRAIHADLAGFMSAFTDETAYAQVRAEFVDQVRPLVAAGAEMALALYRLTGATVSRRGTYAKASPDSVNEFLGARW